MPDVQERRTPDFCLLGNDTVAFAADLFRASPSGSNLIVSPYSIAAALSLVYLGARGNAASALESALRFRVPFERLHPAFAKLNELILGDDRVELSMANALWHDAGLVLSPEYVAESRRHYGTVPRALDFKGDPVAAAERINAWAAEATRGRIQGVVDASGLRTIRLVLANALYFKGAWAHPFEPAETREEAFRLSAGREVPVRMMRRREEFLYGESETARWVQLPYRGSLSMLIVLPRDPEGLRALELGLSQKVLDRWAIGYAEREVDLALPRFRIESCLELGATLSALGLGELFTDEADLSGFCAEPVKLDSAVHKAFVEVNEEGTEAAAVTVMTGVCTAAVPLPPVEFRADRPFLFFIRQDGTNAILFQGRVEDPRG